jgi:hypothetical protein
MHENTRMNTRLISGDFLPLHFTAQKITEAYMRSRLDLHLYLCICVCMYTHMSAIMYTHMSAICRHKELAHVYE